MGLDILETPVRGLSLLVRYCNPDKAVLFMLDELKKFAIISGQDYFSYEPFGEYMGNYLCSEGNVVVSEVRPRIFRKIMNN